MGLTLDVRRVYGRRDADRILEADLPAWPMPFVVSVRPVAAVALALVLSGCFQLASVLTVRPDGSGTLEDRVTLSETALGFARMADSTDAEGGLADREALEARAAALGPGVRLLRVDEAEDGYTAVYAFDDVSAIQYTLPRPPIGEDAGEDDDQRPFAFAFERGATSTLRVTVPDDDQPEADTTTAADETDPEQTRQMLAMMRMMLGEAHVSVALRVDGEIVETDAEYVDGGSVTLLDLQMGALIDVLDEHPELMGRDRPPLGEIRAMLGDTDGLQIQPPGTLSVRFR